MLDASRNQEIAGLGDECLFSSTLQFTYRSKQSWSTRYLVVEATRCVGPQLCYSDQHHPSFLSHLSKERGNPRCPLTSCKLCAIHLAHSQASAPPWVSHAFPNHAVILTLQYTRPQWGSRVSPHALLACQCFAWDCRIHSCQEQVVSSKWRIAFNRTQEIHGNKLLEIKCLFLFSYLYQEWFYQRPMELCSSYLQPT